MLLTRVFPRFTAGVCRSKSVRGPDDGVGPTVDEFFTLSLGGMVTVSAPTFASLSAAALCVLTAPLPRAAPQHVGGEHFCWRLG